MSRDTISPDDMQFLACMHLRKMMLLIAGTAARLPIPCQHKSPARERVLCCIPHFKRCQEGCRAGTFQVTCLHKIKSASLHAIACASIEDVFVGQQNVSLRPHEAFHICCCLSKLYTSRQMSSAMSVDAIRC